MRPLLALALALWASPALAQTYNPPVAGGSGTVLSVGLSVPALSIFGVSGSPVTTTGTLGLTTTGTSGGIPYFGSASTLSSSAALTANLPVFGGGAGAAPVVGTRSGNTTQVVTTTGTQTSGDCVKIDANGNHIANGSACGTILNNSIGGCTLSNDGGTPNTILDMAACTAADSTNAAVISAGAFTKSTGGAWTSGTGNNGMGNGLTIANSTWYHVCLANNGGTADYWFDTSVTCANRPSGISDTKYRRIGSFRTNGSAQIIAFFQYGDLFVWKAPVTDANNQTYGTTPTLVTLTVPTGVPVQAHVGLYTGANAGALLAFTPAASSSTTANGNVSCGGGGVAATVDCNSWVITNTSAQIDVLAGGAGQTGNYINTSEWRDFRGQ